MNESNRECCAIYVQCIISVQNLQLELLLNKFKSLFRIQICKHYIYFMYFQYIHRGQFTEQITAKYWYTHTQSIATQTHSQCMRSHGRDLASHLKAFIRGSRRPHLQRIKNSKWANEYSISSFDEIHNRKWVKAQYSSL